MKNVPKLRFREFDREMKYAEHSFNDIFLFSTGKNIKQNESSPDFDIPCVRYGELYHMYGEVIKTVISKTNLDKTELLFSDGDEILLPSAGEDPMDIGSASALTVSDVAIGRTINILKPAKEGVYLPVYVAFYINEKLKRKISTLAKGVSISNVYNTDLKTLKINLPSLEEQTKIAQFLTSIDDRLSSLKKKKALLEEYKKGMMQKIFSREVRFRDEDGSWFGEWEKLHLKDVSERIKTKNLEDNQNVLTISAQYGLISQLDFFNKSVAAKDLTGYYLLQRNDFAYNKSYSSGYPVGAIKRLTKYDKGVVSTLYICFRLNSKFDFSFAEQYFESQVHNSEIEKIMQEGARNHGLLNVGVHDFFETQILLPCIKEQTKIAQFLTAFDDKIAQTAAQIEKTEVFKKGLLAEMFV